MQTANGHTEIASLYSTATNTFVPVHFPTLAFCSGTAFGPDGEAWVIGGAPLVWHILSCALGNIVNRAPSAL